MKKPVIIILLYFSFSMFLDAKSLLLLEMPEQEKQFIDVISKAQKETVGAANEMLKGKIRADREDAICKIITNHNIEDWVGKISILESVTSP